jgi:hypothetical protein
VETLIRTGLDGQMSATVEKQFPINQCVYHAALALCLAAAATAGCRSAESQMPQKATIMKSDVEQLLQMTLDLEKLDGYFHVDERPERKPLRILWSGAIPSSVKLQKFGEPVVIIAREEASHGPYLEFTKVEVGDETGEVIFVYPPEGIGGTVKFRKSGGSWRVESLRLTEE